MKKILATLVVLNLAVWTFLGVLYAQQAQAGAIKTWSSGEVLTSSDLNTTMQHIHNAMVGGHGARLVNADVSATAAISHTKLAVPALVPKAWSYMSAACAASPCTVSATSGVTSITRSGAGLYVVNYAARANANYSAIVVSSTSGKAFCTGAIAGVSSTSVTCYDDTDTPTAADGQFNFLLMDDDS